VDVLLPAGRSESPLIKNTLAKDPTKTEADALQQIYSLLRPGDAPNLETARQAIQRLFFNPKRYDLGRVGRHKINHRLKLKTDPNHTVLTEEDFIAIVRYLIDLADGRGHTDDIDHLGNRRIRSVGELIANQFSVGLSRMARLVKERMSINSDPEKISLDDLVNARTVSAVIQAFFGSSQLSQFMDQTNPLAELTNKRRLSALGPGGLTRERAGFEVRDVHYSQYGRMCPIETPEGPNIGLITSLATFARINDLGFIETPYRVVKNGKATNEIRWLSATEEEGYAIAQANAAIAADGGFTDTLVLCRRGDDYPLLAPERIDFMDVAPDQLVSIAAALIPFLEHDDANRALMGSNMQRQAVPLLFPRTPIVGTGLEGKVAEDSGAVIMARRAGVITRVTADEIIIDAGQDGPAIGEQPLARLAQVDRYRVKKFWRTNQDTAINQRPLVQIGQRVAKGAVIADGAATERGELALGANVTVAFMPWYGHNFEDAIVLSSAWSRTTCTRRSTSRSSSSTSATPSAARRRSPGKSQRLGRGAGGPRRAGHHPHRRPREAGRHPGRQDHAEGRDRAVAGREAADRDLRREGQGREGFVAQGAAGHEGHRDRREDLQPGRGPGRREGPRRADRRGASRRARGEGAHQHRDVRRAQGAARRAGSGPDAQGRHGREYAGPGTKLSGEFLADTDLTQVDLKTLAVVNKNSNERIRATIDMAARERARVEEKAEDQIDKILQPDELPPGVIQLVKVYLGEKRKISVGDKMAGRHGNKGIVARIVPEEDMPFLPDGRPVDIVLNPLGVPSRMNVGQILETHLGWAATLLGFQAKTPVFRGATETEIGILLPAGRTGLGGAGALAQASRAGSECHHHQRAARRPAGDRTRHPDRGDAGAVDRQACVRHHEVAGGQAAELPGRGGQRAGRARAVAPHPGSGAPPRPRRGRPGRPREGSAEGAEGPGRCGRRERDRRAHPGWLPGAREARERGTAAADVAQAAEELIKAAGLTPAGKVRLRDGRSGVEFNNDVTVGAIYMLKLSHLVDDKIHARSIGPYSLVTQQPLAGKAQFGGQRFGEMEVWALEAYGAAHLLQEMLTVKSDDVNGRSKVYEAIVKGQNLPDPGIPESFNVLVKELQALGLKVNLGTTAEGEE
jgi:DNA-directed RNA polymerase subunit beta